MTLDVTFFLVVVYAQECAFTCSLPEPLSILNLSKLRISTNFAFATVGVAGSVPSLRARLAVPKRVFMLNFAKK